MVALDHATNALMEQMAASGLKPLHESTPEEARQLSAAFADMAGPGPRMARDRKSVV